MGEATLGMDRFLRVVGLDRAVKAELEVLDPEARQVLESYVSGVNAYLASRKGRLPVEFSLLGFQPEPWRLVDGLYFAGLIAWDLCRNWDSELIRGRLATRLGADLASDLDPPYPADNPPIVPGPGIPEGALRPPNGWGSEAVREALQVVERLFSFGSSPPNPPAAPALGPGAGGSNQWVVSGSRSASGQPLLANDTHLALAMPLCWYQMHLHGGGYHVTGGSFPGMPGVVIGHNEYCAWGMTIAWQDQQDLYVEKLNPDNPHQYEYQGEWLDAEVVHEEIGVKGREKPVRQKVVITRHGPLISDLVGEETPLSMRWAGHLEPSNLMRAVLGMNGARNWEEFRAAMADWCAPSMNCVYADVDGNIGYQQAGRVPIRAGGYGLAPVPGWSGEYEWQGFLPFDELPRAFNPESGWLATSNNLVVDENYAHFLSADLENPCRARRVADLITAKTGLTADDFARFQLDTYSAQAERFVQHLLELEPETEEERRALACLRVWDYHLEPDSVAASLYRICRLRALYVVFGGHLGDLVEAYVGAQGLSPLHYASAYHDRSPVRLLNLLDQETDEYWLQDPLSGRMRSRQEVLRQALQETLSLLHGRFGPDMSRWTWGRLNQMHFSHSLGASKPLRLLLNRGPYPMGGDGDTLSRGLRGPRFPFDLPFVGDSLRFIADPSDWENCRICMPGGQSGHAADRHYADLIQPWREGRYQPMPFGRDRVQSYAVRRLLLRPA